jgi:hypothetical protein
LPEDFQQSFDKIEGKARKMLESFFGFLEIFKHLHVEFGEKGSFDSSLWWHERNQNFVKFQEHFGVTPIANLHNMA